MNWIYERSSDNAARFALGVKGDDPLVCFGINPSTAEPGKPDQTIRCVQNLSAAHGFDGFLMLNIYPQRATNPNDLHEAFSMALKIENEHHIAKLIDGKSLTVWAAWGSLIQKRSYLLTLAKSIILMPELLNVNWVARGALTQNGHPHHPLYVKSNVPFTPFDPSHYLMKP